MGRNRSGYWAGLERPISWCDRCWIKGIRTARARFGKEGRTLCHPCRAALKVRPLRKSVGFAHAYAGLAFTRPWRTSRSICLLATLRCLNALDPPRKTWLWPALA